jgi:hypothetical protein
MVAKIWTGVAPLSEINHNEVLCLCVALGSRVSSLLAATLPAAAFVLTPLASLAEEAVAEAPAAVEAVAAGAEQPAPSVLSYAIVLSPLILYGKKQ